MARSRTRGRWLAGIMTLIVLLGLAGAGARSVTGAHAAADPSPDVLLAADTQLAEVRQTLGADWQQWYPQVETKDYLAPSDETYLVRAGLEYRHYGADGSIHGYVTARVALYGDEAAAKAALAALLADEADSTPVSGVAKLGDDSIVLRYEWPATGNPAEDAYRFEVYSRYRVGRALGLVSVILPAYTSVENVMTLATAQASRTSAALAGTLNAPALPAALAAVAPPATLTGVGPRLAQTALEAETFPQRFDPGPRARDIARLHSFGATTYLLARYAIPSIRDHVVDVSIIPMKDEASARQFTLYDSDGAVSKTSLPTGNTGPYSIFGRYAEDDGRGNYDYQFARNRYFVGVLCQGFDVPVEDGCQEIARKTAEAVVALIPADTTPPIATPTQPPKATPSPTAPSTPTATATTATGTATATTATPTRQAPLPPNTGRASAGGDGPWLVAALAVMMAAAAGGAGLVLARRRTD